MLEGLALTLLAEACVGRGRIEAGRDYARRALDSHRETRHRLGEARTLVVLGDVQLEIEGSEAALARWRAARKLFSSIGSAVPEDLVARMSKAEPAGSC